MPKAKKTKLKDEPIVEPTIVEPTIVEPTIVEPTITEPVVESPTKQKTEYIRKVVNQDTVMESFLKLTTQLEKDIAEIREDKTQTKGIKFLKSINKEIKEIQSQTVKVLKQKEKRTRKSSNNISGFKKPVVISPELAKFAGWNDNELHSRVDVTNYICDYIKKNDLQNPTDRRNINPDKKLKKLLGITDDSKPLKYYNIQTHLKTQDHYPK